ncbi:hypothetical protein DFA_01625 [Cavenderia fasciculata]|uniref:Uncharacterized protein n=1 Tax=Cavenderia fasciculata TaxID=261658 RepID=F4PTR9_CACFS|nr:uncharacterized protein DFA_01625 [Cavenderia fasciculata]EGG21739.1 hypothetical protein DFA_01625 [Cavenderia fasciculata]|eukprot:XP_004359589.1 hypothetical protein DFA_01625 [Cavenderia fasciculata]
MPKEWNKTSDDGEWGSLAKEQTDDRVEQPEKGKVATQVLHAIIKHQKHKCLGFLSRLESVEECEPRLGNPEHAKVVVVEFVEVIGSVLGMEEWPEVDLGRTDDIGGWKILVRVFHLDHVLGRELRVKQIDLAGISLDFEVGVEVAYLDTMPPIDVLSTANSNKIRSWYLYRAVSGT